MTGRPQYAGTTDRLRHRRVCRSWSIYDSTGVEARFQLEILVCKPGAGANSAAPALGGAAPCAESWCQGVEFTGEEESAWGDTGTTALASMQAACIRCSIASGSDGADGGAAGTA